MKKLPIYKALVKTDDEGMFVISLVDEAATLVDWMAFEKEKEPVMFAVNNEEKHIVRGVIMRCGFPIYRKDKNGYEYYLQYDAETIRLMAEKYLFDGFQNRIDTQHSFDLVDGVNMVQWFIKDSANGINPKGFEEIEEGSLFAEYKVNNEEVWNKIKDGTFKGFSLAGMFETELIEDQQSKEEEEILSLINKIKAKIK